MTKRLLHNLYGNDAQKAPFGKCRECHANTQINDYGECYHCEMEQEAERLTGVIDALKLACGNVWMTNDELIAFVDRMIAKEEQP